MFYMALHTLVSRLPSPPACRAVRSHVNNGERRAGEAGEGKVIGPFRGQILAPLFAVAC